VLHRDSQNLGAFYGPVKLEVEKRGTGPDVIFAKESRGNSGRGFPGQADSVSEIDFSLFRINNLQNLLF
jgi:hypothetical protein